MADNVLVKMSESNPTELILSIVGRLDSSNAAAVETDLLAGQADHPHKSLVVDLSDLEYISSAGLRVILKLRKAEKDMTLENVSPDVYDVFEMTGFTEMIPTHKAYRVMSVDGCEIIGKGANGAVYRIDPETIIKVYLNPDSLPDILRERELARRAFVLGIPTAISYDVVRVGEGFGSVFELLNADSFLQMVIKDPSKVDALTDMSVELLKRIHATTVRPEDMPDIKPYALSWTQTVAPYLTGAEAVKLVSLMATVKDSNQMIHGDYHWKNIMMQNGEAILIDMDTLSHGNPIFEFAAIYNAYQGFSAIDHDVVKHFLGIDYETATHIWKRTLSLYFDQADEKELEEIEKKVQIVSYTRLLRRTVLKGTDNGTLVEETIAFYKEHLGKLLLEVNDLSL